MRRTCALALIAAAAGRPAPTSAHVAPALEDNHRYLKLTPLGDRVRLAYLVLYGERPGRALRAALDADGDGSIADREAAPHGARLGADVARGLAVTVDGAPRAIAWEEVRVGLGDPRARGGAVAVDLIATICLAPGPPASHALTLRDRFALPGLGETEVRVDEGVGVRIDDARVGAAALASGLLRLVGPTELLAGPGLALAFTTTPRAPRPADGRCEARRRGQARWAAPAALAGLAAVAGIAGIVRRRRGLHRGASTGGAARASGVD
jgi:hypothetical protein